METQESIIYRLVLTNPGLGPDLPFLIFWALKEGVAPQKVDPLGGPFGSPVISKSFFQLSDLGPSGVTLHVGAPPYRQRPPFWRPSST